jgi:hypothetical protein
MGSIESRLIGFKYFQILSGLQNGINGRNGTIGVLVLQIFSKYDDCLGMRTRRGVLKPGTQITK